MTATAYYTIIGANCDDRMILQYILVEKKHTMQRVQIKISGLLGWTFLIGFFDIVHFQLSLTSLLLGFNKGYRVDKANLQKPKLRMKKYFTDTTLV